MSRLFSRLIFIGNIHNSSGVLLIRGSVKYFSQIRKRIKKDRQKDSVAQTFGLDAYVRWDAN